MSGQVFGSANRRVEIGGKVIQSIINTGDHNQFFMGDYEQLRDAYIRPWPVFERLRLDRFTGREWLVREIDKFLKKNDRGLFVLEAEAGVGKTAFMAHLVNERGYIHHFVEQAPGKDGVAIGLRSLAAQLVLAWELNPWMTKGVLPGAAARPDYLQNLLGEAAKERDQKKPNEKIVIVVDALDEAGAPDGQNVMGLPRVLPKGVYLIVSQRPVQVSLVVDGPRRVYKFATTGEDNLIDMRLFLEKAAGWDKIKGLLEASQYSAHKFVSTLLEKCNGVWIYLQYIVDEIENDARTPLDLDELPDGLTQYYARYWGRWRDEDEERWYTVYLPVLGILAAAQEAISLSQIADWTGKLTPEGVLRRLLRERWRPFMVITGSGKETRFRFYHNTLREFFTGLLEFEKLSEAEIIFIDELVSATHNASEQIAGYYLDRWGGIEAGLPKLGAAAVHHQDNEYGLRHLVTHLSFSGLTEQIQRLFFLENNEYHNTWYLAKSKIGDITGFINDLGAAQKHAGAPESPDIGRQIYYALIESSVRSLAGKVLPNQLTLLVQRELLSFDHAVRQISLVPDNVQKAQALAKLAPLLPLTAAQPQRQLFEAATEIETETDRAHAFIGITPYLHNQLKGEVLLEIQKMRSEEPKRWVICGIVEYLPDEMILKALEIAQNMTEPYEQVHALIGLHETLPANLKCDNLQKAKEAAGRIAGPGDRADALIAILKYVPHEHRAAVVNQALEAVGRIEAQGAKPGDLAKLVANFPHEVETSELKLIVINKAFEAIRSELGGTGAADALVQLSSCLPEESRQEALAIALGMEENSWPRAKALSGLADHFPEPKRTEIIEEALITARMVGHPWTRAHALFDVAGQLSDKHKDEAIRSALQAVREDRDESWRVSALSAVSSPLSKELSAEALDIAQGFTNLVLREEAIDAIIEYLVESDQETVIRGITAGQKKIGDEAFYALALAEQLALLPEPTKTLIVSELLEIMVREWVDDSQEWILAQVISRLGEHLPGSRSPDLLKVVARFSDEGIRTQALSGLAKQMPDKILPFVPKLKEGANRADLLGVLAPYLNHESIATAYKMACKIDSERNQAQAILSLLPYLPEERTRQVFGKFCNYEHEWMRVEALTKLIRHAPPRLKPEVIDAAYEAVFQIDYGSSKWMVARELLEMKEYLSEDQKRNATKRAIRSAKSVKDPGERSEALITVAGIAPEKSRISLIGEACQLLLSGKIEKESEKEQLLTRLAPYVDCLPEPAQKGILDTALGLMEQWSKVSVLCLLAQYLGAANRAIALDEARNVARAGLYALARVGDLLQIAERLSGEEKLELLAEALVTASQAEAYVGDERAGYFARILSLYRELEFEGLSGNWALWNKIFSNLRNHRRSELFREIAALAAMIAQLGGEEVVAESCLAMRDVCRWWP